MSDDNLQNGQSESLEIAVDALRKTVDALLVLKTLVKSADDLTPDQLKRSVALVNDGYDHGVAALTALTGKRYVT